MARVTAALVAGLNVHSFGAGRAVAAAGARPFAGCTWTQACHAVTRVLEAQAAQRALLCIRRRRICVQPCVLSSGIPR